MTLVAFSLYLFSIFVLDWLSEMSGARRKFFSEYFLGKSQPRSLSICAGHLAATMRQTESLWISVLDLDARLGVSALDCELHGRADRDY